MADIPINSKYYKSIYRAFENAKYMKKKVWGKRDFIFKYNEGNATYCSVMINKLDDEDYVYPPATNEDYEEPLCSSHEKYFVLFVYLKLNLKLSSNINVERKEERWGVWRDKTSLKIVEKPKDVERKDIDALFSFFNLLALKALANKYKIEYEAPPIKVSSNPSS